MRGKMDCCGLSDTGKVRQANEDQFLVADLNKSMRVQHTSLGIEDQSRLFGGSQGTLLVVADGAGGDVAGDRASTLAVDSVANYVLNNMRWFFRLHEDPQDDFLDDLTAALEHCQTTISAEAESIPTHKGMGTTVTLAYVVWPRLYVVHAGNSRCYLLRESTLKQITRDHTIAEQLVEAGAIQPEEAETSQWSNTLWNVVGGDSDALVPEVYKAELRIGDTLLLCTDGLNKHVPDGQIAQLLDGDADAERTCRRLVEAANDAGGTDNITVVVARFREPREQQDVFQAEASLDEIIAKTSGDTETETATAENVTQPELALEGPDNRGEEREPAKAENPKK
jgi:protein phosphatase